LTSLRLVLLVKPFALVGPVSKSLTKDMEAGANQTNFCQTTALIMRGVCNLMKRATSLKHLSTFPTVDQHAALFNFPGH